MNLKKFQYIEDYIEYIGGYKKPNGGTLYSVKSPISLARYDVAIIDSFCQQSLHLAQGYTEKQASLAKSLVAKYERQLKQNGIAMPDSFDNFKLPIRVISYAKSVDIDTKEKKFIVKFPFDGAMVQRFRELKNSKEIMANFDYEAKAWKFSLTEYSLNYILAVCNKTSFQYSPEVSALIDEMMRVESVPYEIKLTVENERLTINNASSSMIEWIEKNIGDIDFDNLKKLIDVSTTLGYTVDEDLLSIFEDNDFYRRLISQKSTKVKLKDFNFDQILEYARMFGRTPVYTYVPSFRNLIKFTHPDLIHIDKNKPQMWPDSTTTVKLFISQSPILIGVRKNNMIKMAEKVIILDEIV